MRYTLSEIPGGIAGTDKTVQEIARLVRYDLERPQLRLIASRLLNNHAIQSKNHLAEVQTIFNFVSGRIRYQKDPVDIETVQSPIATLEIGAGDCDDHVGLVAGLAMAVGIPARLRVVGYSENRFVHIFSELFVDGKWYPADTTEPQREFGWRPPKFPVERVYNLNGEVHDMSGNGFSRLTRGEFKRSIESNVGQTLSSNWQAGLIDLNDVRGYLRVIEEGNFPTKNELVVEPTKKAIQTFADHVVYNRIASNKRPGSTTGLEGLDGFLSSVWSGIKKVAGAAVGLVTGGSATATPTVVQVQAPAPVATAPVATAPVVESGLFSGSSMVPIMIAAGLAVILIVRK